MQKLTPGDKNFIKLTEDGVKPSRAFREAYPDHKAVIMWNQAASGTPEKQKAAEYIKQAAKYKLGAKYIQKATSTYQDSMERFSELSVQTAIDLVQNGKSEKVRADLAIEGMRQKVGAPTQKVAVQEEKTVVLTFGEPPKDELPAPVQAQVIDVAVEEIKKEVEETPVINPVINHGGISDLFSEDDQYDTGSNSDNDTRASSPA